MNGAPAILAFGDSKYSQYLCCIVATSICRDCTIVVAVVLLQRLQVLRTFRWGNWAPVLDASHYLSLACLGISCNCSSTFMQNTRLDIFPRPHFSLQSPNELAYLEDNCVNFCKTRLTHQFPVHSSVPLHGWVNSYLVRNIRFCHCDNMQGVLSPLTSSSRRIGPR